MDTILTHALRGLRDNREAGDDHIVVLIKAARKGHITNLECAMPTCACPEGRTFFTRRGAPPNGPWGPSADRWPVAGRDGGGYTVDNVRLAHRWCNQSEGGRVGGGRNKGLKYQMTPEGHAAHVAQGRRLGQLARTPEQREAMRERGRVMGRIGGSRGGPARAARAATPEGRAELLARLAKGLQTPEQLAANARKANCVRWAIGRDKPCTCGMHV